MFLLVVCMKTQNYILSHFLTSPKGLSVPPPLTLLWPTPCQLPPLLHGLGTERPLGISV